MYSGIRGGNRSMLHHRPDDLKETTVAAKGMNLLLLLLLLSPGSRVREPHAVPLPMQ